MDDSITSVEKGAASNASEFHLFFCPKCRKLLTEFAHIPLYRCDPDFQGKNFRSGPSGMLNHSTLSSLTREENSSPSSSCFEEYGPTLDSKCLNNQSETDTSYSERVATNFDSNIVKAPSIFDNENQCSGMNKYSGKKEHWNGRTALRNLEPFDGRKIVDSSFNRKHSDTSDELHSLQDRMTFESDSSFKDLFTNTESAILDCDRMQMLRQIDELRDQLLRAHIQSRTDRRDCVRVRDQARHLPWIDSFQSSHGACEHSLSMLQHPVSLFETRNHMAHAYRGSRLPSMLSQHPLDHLHAMSKNHCQACGSCNLSPSRSSEIYKSYCHMCSHPPGTKGSHYYTQQKAICRHDAERHKLEVRNQNGKVGNQSAKCHVRPVLGGSCFISCYKCSQVLKITEEFHFSMRTHGKLRCGACFRVLVFSVYEKTRIVPYCFAVSQLLPGEIGNNGDATEHGRPSPRRYLTRDGWFSYSAGYEMSPTISYSTEVGNRQQGESSEIQQPLHSLMGYISASEILYDN